MKRPSFQFYPADWRNNAKLRRCSEAARGAWMDILCILHDSDEYGILRWPLEDIARAAGVELKYAEELAKKDVLKGSDGDVTDFTYTPRHAGQDGDTVVLIRSCKGPCWYSSRMVTDEWIRNRRGSNTQFKETPKDSPKPPNGELFGGGFGDGPTSTSTSTSPSTASAPSPTPPPTGGNGGGSGWKPTDIQLRLAALFKRKPTTKWSERELKAFRAIGEIDEQDLKLVEQYYTAKIPVDDWRRRDLQTLLNNFTGEVDRARKFISATSKPKVQIPRGNL